MRSLRAVRLSLTRKSLQHAVLSARENVGFPTGSTEASASVNDLLGENCKAVNGAPLQIEKIAPLATFRI